MELLDPGLKGQSIRDRAPINMEPMFDQLLVFTFNQIESFSHKMNSTIFFSCLVFIIGSLAWTASARRDQKFQSEFTRLKNIYGNDSGDQVTKLRNVPNLMDFYEKYSNRFHLTRKERLEADRLLRQFKETTANRPLTEGVPPQGGSWDILMDLATAIIRIINKPIKNEN